jgi:chain length determinant protein (polysaccharide antigen chain regulator)
MNDQMLDQVKKSSIPVSEPYIVYAHYPPHQEDDINLVEIGQVLIQNWRLIFWVTLAVTLAALTYAFSAPSIYKADIFLLPPLEKNVQGLNRLELNIQEHSPESVYNLFVRNLHSRSLRRRLFEEQNLVEHLAPNNDSSTQDIFEKFNKALTISRNLRKPGQEEFITVSVETGDALLSAEVLNSFIRLVNAETSSALIQGVEEKLNSQKQFLQNKIANKDKLVQQYREDRLQMLDKAAFVIERGRVKGSYADMNRPTSPIVEVLNPTQEPGKSRYELEEQRIDIREIKELLFDLSKLQEQLFDLRQLQERLALLELIKFDRNAMTAVTIDQWAISPEEQVKPKRLLIVSISFVVGLIISVCLAFFLNALKQQREQSKS